MFFGGGGGFPGGDPFGDMGGGFPGGHPGQRQQRRAPADTKKLYDLLGVQKSDEEGTIKKAYRKLAVKMHPDKGGDPAKFQEIQEAWEILGDEKKRAIYDKHGMEGVKESAERGGGRGGGTKKGPATKSTIKATLEQIYLGNQRQLRITRKVIAKNSKQACSRCQGQGVVVQVIRMGPMVQQVQAACDRCGGEGFQFKHESASEVLDVHIPKGAPNGHKVTFNEKANEIPDGDAGDVILTIAEQPHDRFKRKGDDLFISRKISLSDALCGFAMEVTHLDGRKLIIKTKPGDVIRPCSFDPMAETGETESAWEAREDSDCPTLDDAAEGRTADPAVCQKVIAKGELKGKGIGAFVIKGGRAVFKQCTRDEALAAMKPARGATMYVIADPTGGGSGRMMKAVVGEGMPRLSNPFEKGNLFLQLEIEFPAEIPPAAQAALLAAIPKKHQSTSPEDGENTDVVMLSDVDPVASFAACAKDESDDEEEGGQRGQGGVQCAQS